MAQQKNKKSKIKILYRNNHRKKYRYNEFNIGKRFQNYFSNEIDGLLGCTLNEAYEKLEFRNASSVTIAEKVVGICDSLREDIYSLGVNTWGQVVRYKKKKKVRKRNEALVRKSSFTQLLLCVLFTV